MDGVKDNLDKRQCFQFEEKNPRFFEKVWTGLKIFCRVEALEVLKLGVWLHVFLQGYQVYKAAAGFP